MCVNPLNGLVRAAPSVRPTFDSPDEAPWVAAWTGDVKFQQKVVLRSSLPGGCGLPGIAFEDELPSDRGRHDVLLSRGRRPAPPGTRGEPRFGDVLLIRQRRAMRVGRLLCQVLGCPAAHDERGWLWLLPKTGDEYQEGWPERDVTAHPPVSLKGAAKAVQRCPELAEHCTAVRVRNPRPYGVIGDLCGRDLARPAAPFPAVVEKEALVAYEDRARLPWILASQAVLRLVDCTVVDIRTELAVAGEL